MCGATGRERGLLLNLSKRNPSPPCLWKSALSSVMLRVVIATVHAPYGDVTVQLGAFRSECAQHAMDAAYTLQLAGVADFLRDLREHGRHVYAGVGWDTACVLMPEQSVTCAVADDLPDAPFTVAACVFPVLRGLRDGTLGVAQVEQLALQGACRVNARFCYGVSARAWTAPEYGGSARCRWRVECPPAPAQRRVRPRQGRQR